MVQLAHDGPFGGLTVHIISTGLYILKCVDRPLIN